MANVNLSLDEIISKNKGGGNRRVGGGMRRAAGGGGRPGPSRRTGGRDKYFSDDVPSGKWKHDKYFEAYGGGKRQNGGGGSRPAVSGGARRTRGSGGKEMVKLSISNLPETVLTEDLEELFADFSVFGVAVHYDETGAHLGTATLFVSPGTAKDIVREYANIAIDGQEIKIGIVDESGAIARGGRINERIRRIGGGGNQARRRTSSNGVGGRRSGGGRVTKPDRGGGSAKKPILKKMTAEELDKELESYMSNRLVKN